MSDGAALFGPVEASRVAFCVDTSESMRRLLAPVRDHLKAALSALTTRPGTRFNMAEYGGADGVQLWSERLTVAGAEMVAAAHEWVDAMRPSTTASEESGEDAADDDLLEAVRLLSDDNAVEALHLVTARPPIAKADALDALVDAADRLPLHCVLLCERRPRRRDYDLLTMLAEDTGGTMRAFVVQEDGQLCPVRQSDDGRSLVCRHGRHVDSLSESRCSVSTALSSADPVDEWHRVYNGSLQWLYCWRHPTFVNAYFRPTPDVLAVGEKYRRDHLLMTHNSDEAGNVLVGRRVLARRADRGTFHRAVVQKKISLHEFLVTFCSRTPTSADDFETVHLTDLIDLDDASRNSVSVADHVLAPRGVTEPAAFEPAVVVFGFERRGARSPSLDSPVVVTFPDGETTKTEAGEAVWIPGGLYTRFLLQLGMSAGERATSLENAEALEEAEVSTSVSAGAFGLPAPTWYLPPAFCHPFWRIPLPLRRLPDQRLDLRACSQPIFPSSGPTTGVKGCLAAISQSAASIEQAAAGTESPAEAEQSQEAKEKTEETPNKEEEENEGEEDINLEKNKDLEMLVEEPLPFREKGPFVDGFADEGHPVALSRPPLRAVHRKPPWRYWGQRDIPPYGDGPSFEPYRDPESLFGKPFAMTADLYPRPKEEPPSRPRRLPPAEKLRLPAGLLREDPHEDRLHAMLHRADLGVALRDDLGLSRVRADRRERLIRRHVEGLQERAQWRREAGPEAGTRERWAHGQWDWLDRRLLAGGRHSEMARTQFLQKARQV